MSLKVQIIYIVSSDNKKKTYLLFIVKYKCGKLFLP